MEENIEFVPTHIHTSRGSLLDGMVDVEGLPKHAKANNMPAVACTDHGSMASVLEFVDACRKQDVKPLPGIEAYTTMKKIGEDGKVEKGPEEDGSRNYHLILLARNDEGLRDLFEMNSIAYKEGMWFKPRMDIELIEEYASKGNLIASTACLGSLASQLIGRGETAKAKAWVQRLSEAFGPENLFLEVQAHGKHESGRFQRQVNEQLIQWSDELDLPLLMTGDSHFTKPSDDLVHKQLLAMQTNAKMWYPTREDQDAADEGGGAFRFSFDVTPIISGNEMLELAEIWGIPESAVHNSVYLADRIEDDFFNDKRNRYPRFEGVPDGMNAHEYVARLARAGLTLKFQGKPPKEYRDQLEYELTQLKMMDFSDYLLIMHEWLTACKGAGIHTGPGRGCLHPDSMIRVIGGWKPIVDVVPEDLVLTSDGDWNLVTAVHQYPTRNECLVRLSTAYSCPTGMSLTTDHKVLVSPAVQVTSWTPANGGYKTIQAPSAEARTWMPAGRIQRGDWIFVPEEPHGDRLISIDVRHAALSSGIIPNEDLEYTEYPVPRSPATMPLLEWHSSRSVHECPPKLIPTPDTLWVMGKWMADGWIRESLTRMGICYNPELEEEHGTRIRLWLERCGITEWIEQPRGPTSHDIDINNRILTACWYQLFGDVKSHNKRWPAWTHSLDREQVQHLLRGYAEGDGHRKGYHVSCKTISKTLAEGTKNLVNRIGFPCYIRPYKRSDGGQEYNIVFPAMAIYPDVENNVATGFWKATDGYYVQVRDVRSEKAPAYVYDLSVDTQHDYLSEIGIVHNSAPGSLVAYALDITKIDPIRYKLSFARFMALPRTGNPMYFRDSMRNKLEEYLEVHG